MSLLSRLVYLRRWRLAREMMALYCVEIPAAVRIGRDLRIVHRGFGTVIHSATEIRDRVTIYHQVTIGRGDAHVHGSFTKMERIIIEDDVILYPGAKILGKAGILTVAKGTIVAANAVLTKSTGPNEVWAGVPARKVGMRPISS